MENWRGLDDLPVIVLVKHQSTYETFLMPVIMPHPVSYVFKKELLSIPFLAWAIACLDMIHIDLALNARRHLQRWLSKVAPCFQRAIGW
jgi:1-acyl-sn-glycerol-3-phosphate acyltransferase